MEGSVGLGAELGPSDHTVTLGEDSSERLISFCYHTVGALEEKTQSFSCLEGR